MKKVFIYAIAMLFSVFLGQAQDVKQAKSALDAEKYQVAKKTLETITASAPSDGYAKFLLGTVYIHDGDYENAKKQFDEGINCSSKGNLNYIGLGYIALDKGDTAEAEKNFELATKNGSKNKLEESVYTAKAYTYSEKPNYNKAIEILKKSRTMDPNNTDVLLALGDAYKLSQKQNEAYECYRTAFKTDGTLLRAKLGLASLIKNTQNFPGAMTSLNEVVAMNPNYGPAYRELADTEYQWAKKDTKNYASHISKGLTYYKKYMSLTDNSLESRMRYADFLILAEDYKALETEANEMAKIENVNPRIYRYLGYSAFHNNNFDTAISSLNSFISNPSNKVIGRDYYYLGATKLSKASAVTPVDNALSDSGILDLKKAFEMTPAIAFDLSKLGKSFFDKKLYAQSASIYEIAIENKQSKSFLLDNFYFAVAVYWSCTGVENLNPQQIEKLNKADGALDKIILASPTTQDAYLFKARIQVLLKNESLVAKSYEDFIVAAHKKDATELASKAMKSKLVEAYNNLGVIYSTTDKTKAKDNFKKALTVDPTNQYASDQLKSLK